MFPAMTTGSSLKVLVFAVVVSGSLILGVTSGFGATPSTPYRTVATDSPDPLSNSSVDVRSAFGTRLTVGDATGDGIPDVFGTSYIADLPLSELPAGFPEDNNVGRAYMIDGATQKVVWKKTYDPQAAPTSSPGGETYGFGFYISSPGDVNGDGKADVVTSNTFLDIDGKQDQGRMYVLDGATGDLIRRIENPAPQANAAFGSRIGATGDVTGDGVGDIITTASSNDIPAGCGNETAPAPPPVCRKDEGQVYIFNGATGALVRTIELPADDRLGCSPTGRCSFGGTVQSPGDVNKDGFADYTISAFAYNSFAGRAYLFSGAPNGGVLARIDPPESQPFGFFSLEDPDRNAPGDLNGDGVPDLYFSGFNQNKNGLTAAGRGWTFDGKSTVSTGTGKVLYELTDPFLGERRAFGWSNSQTDYNKDGRPDLFTSNLSKRDTNVDIFNGPDGAYVRSFSVPAADQAEEAGGAGPGLGNSARAPGDLNGDCEPDYVAGAPGQDVGGRRDQGKVYFFLSNGPSACPAGSVPPGSVPPGSVPPGSVPPGSVPKGCNSKGVKVLGKTNSGGRVFQGSNGNDRICGTSRGDVITGNGGKDVISGFGGADRINGGSGSDRINGGSSKDRISGSSGNDVIFGSSGNDRINGNSGRDRISGNSGNDRLAGASGKDVISGSTGKDVISGGSGSDRLSGNSGNDRINGDSGNDRISGDSGNDRMKGSSGNDRISGGSGRDRISGGSGRNQVKQ